MSGVVPFVAVALGRLKDPREVLDLADDLKIHPAQALGYLVLWEGFILEKGDGLTGKVKGYTPRHIARELGHAGDPAKLIAALKKAKVLAQQKGTFFVPGWLHTPTGQYASDKAETKEWERERKRIRRAAERAAKLAAAAVPPSNEDEAVPGTSPGQARDVPPMSPSRPDIEQKTRQEKGNSGQAPPNPRASAGGLADARWEWLQENHQRPSNPDGCKRILAGLSDEHWALVQWAAPFSAVKPSDLPRSLSRKKRLFARNTYQLLSRGAYLEIRPEWQAKLREEARPKAAPVPPEKRRAEKAADVAKNEDDALKFLITLLNDPDAPKAKQEKFKRLWIDQHPGQVPPWEIDAVQADARPEGEA
jgi:hypothetical protein